MSSLQGGGGSAAEKSKHDYLLKVLTIGDACTGKSSLLLRYSTNRFTTNYIATIGLDFKTRDLVLDDSKVRLQLWDTAGQERFRTIAVAYFRGANAILLVFDLTTRSSFMAVEGWVRDIDKNADKKVAKILVGNKADLADGEGKRVVSAAEATKMAEAHNMAYMETSAKSGVNVDAAFERLAALALANVKREKQEGSSATAAAPSAKPLNLKKEEREQDKGRGGKSWC